MGQKICKYFFYRDGESFCTNTEKNKREERQKRRCDTKGQGGVLGDGRDRERERDRDQKTQRRGVRERDIRQEIEKEG